MTYQPILKSQFDLIDQATHSYQIQTTEHTFNVAKRWDTHTLTLSRSKNAVTLTAQLQQFFAKCGTLVDCGLPTVNVVDETLFLAFPKYAASSAYLGALLKQYGKPKSKAGYLGIQENGRLLQIVFGEGSSFESLMLIGDAEAGKTELIQTFLLSAMLSASGSDKAAIPIHVYANHAEYLAIDAVSHVTHHLDIGVMLSQAEDLLTMRRTTELSDESQPIFFIIDDVYKLQAPQHKQLTSLMMHSAKHQIYFIVAARYSDLPRYSGRLMEESSTIVFGYSDETADISLAVQPKTSRRMLLKRGEFFALHQSRPIGRFQTAMTKPYNKAILADLVQHNRNLDKLVYNKWFLS